jgi:Putative zinc-finger
MTDYRMTCEDCDELFLQYFEGDLDAATRAKVEAHTSSCARCQGLIRDIEGIQNEAAALPELVPSKDLWKGIEARIQPAVVSIAARKESTVLSRRMLGLAAAALVVVTSSVTYVATSRINKAAQPRQVAEAPNPVPVIGGTDETGPSAARIAEPEPTASEASSEPASKTETPKSEPVRSTPRVGNGSRVSSGPRTSLASSRNAPVSASELALSSEISQLQKMLKLKRNELDPSTVQVVEDNLNLIDVAVKQARAALLKDPASGFLIERLDNALQKKVELLRTVALLPSKT